MKELRTLALLLLVSALLSLSFSLSLSLSLSPGLHGSGGHRLQPNKVWHQHQHHQMKTKMDMEMKNEMMKAGREMGEIEFETNDYDDPKANVNPRSGSLLNPTIPTPVPVTPPPSH